jgi:hypothetical protein
MSQESDEYELFVEKIYKKLLGAKVTVHRRKPYTGRVSGREIVVDVSFNYDLAGADLLCVIECKCYNHAVPVDDVEEFHSKLDDIGAQKGIMITTVGYQDGAMRTAKGRRIALALLTNKSQTGELKFVVNVGGKEKHRGEEEEFFQGNLRAPLDHFEGGYRFDSIHEFLSTLFKAEHEEWYHKKYLPRLE